MKKVTLVYVAGLRGAEPQIIYGDIPTAGTRKQEFLAQHNLTESSILQGSAIDWEALREAFPPPQPAEWFNNEVSMAEKRASNQRAQALVDEYRSETTLEWGESYSD